MKKAFEMTFEKVNKGPNLSKNDAGLDVPDHGILNVTKIMF